MLAGDARVDRDHAIAVVLEELHHAEAGAPGIVRRPDQRDGARLAQQFGNVLVTGQRHVIVSFADPMLHAAIVSNWLSSRRASSAKASPAAPSSPAGGWPGVGGDAQARRQRQAAEEGDAQRRARSPRRRRCRTGRWSRRNAGRNSPPYSRSARAPAPRSCRTGRSRASRRSATGPAGSRRSPRRRAALSGPATIARRRCPGGRSTSSSSVSPQSPSISCASAPDAIGPRHASAWPAGTSCPTDSKRTPLGRDHRDQRLLLGHRAACGRRAGSAATGRKCRRRSCPTRLPIRASATARLAAMVDLPTPPLPDPMAMILRSGRVMVRTTRAWLDPGQRQRRVAHPRLERAALVGRQPARVDHQRGDACPSACASGCAAASASVGQRRQGVVFGHGRAHNRLFDQRHCFSRAATLLWMT